MRAAPIASFALVAAGLAATCWIAYFLLASELGLFQDDVWMYYIVRFTHDGVMREAFDLSRAYGGEGRPATQVVMVLFTWLGMKIGGVTGLYVLNAILITVHALLGHACLRRFFSPRASFLGAAFLVLFPPDAAKFFIVSYMGWVGMILFWIALLMLLGRRILLAALALSATFLMSEAYILPGALLPLLLLADGRDDLRTSLLRALRFWAYYAVLVVPAALLRLVYAPGRATGAFERFDHWMLVKRVLGSMYFGVVSSAASLQGRLQELWRHGDLLAWACAALVAVLLAVVLARLRESRAVPAGPPRAPLPRWQWVVAFGVLAWIAAYPLYGLYPPRFPPTILVGKLSNTHEQAAIGMTFLVALLVHWLERRRDAAAAGPGAAAACAALYLGLVAGYFVLVQERWVQEWHHELSFWRQLPQAVPDLGPNSLVVVEPVGDEIVRIESNSSYDWSMPMLFPMMWRLPASWPAGPLVMNVGFYKSTAHALDAGQVQVSGYPGIPARVFRTSDVTFLRATPGRFVVLDGLEGRPVESRHAEGFPTFNEDLLQPGPLAPGELQLRAAGRRAVIVANDFTAGDWRHGVVLDAKGHGGYTFYFLAENPDSVSVQPGDMLEFEGSGSARVTKVERAPQGGRYAIFVTVNRKLDPDSDGYPHAIFVRP